MFQSEDIGSWAATLVQIHIVLQWGEPLQHWHDQSRMQSHLEECFEEELSLFPLSSVSHAVKRSRLKHLLQFTAFLRGQKVTMTWWSVKAVVATWFHFKCVGLCSSSNTDNWKCSTCSMYRFLLKIVLDFAFVCHFTLHNLQLTAIRLRPKRMYREPQSHKGGLKI